MLEREREELDLAKAAVTGAREELVRQKEEHERRRHELKLREQKLRTEEDDLPQIENGNGFM